MAKGVGDGDSRKVLRMRTSLLITLVVVGVVAVFYLAYYRNQVAYHTGRNSRLLSMLTAQIDGRVDMFAGFVRTFSRENPPKNVTLSECVPEVGPSQSGEVRRDLEEGSEDWRLRLQRAGVGGERVCATVPLTAIVRPLFTRRVGAAFDVLLVANADGTVLYNIRPQGKTSTLLARDRESSYEDEGFEKKTAEESTIVVTKVSALQRRSGWRGETKPLDPSSLTAATANANVTINGQNYVLFTEPYRFASGPASIHGTAQQWIVGGLVSASRFRYEVTGVSITVVLIAMAIVLLAICCWPYLRIAFIHPTQALSISDVVLIVICTIVGAAVLTVAVLDGIAYHRIITAADAQLWRFGDGINEDFGNNIERATIVLDRFDALLSGKVKPGSYPIPPSFKTNPTVAIYPYVKTLAWIDSSGMQQVKFAQEPSARVRVPVHERRYFKEALAGHPWTVNGRSYVLEWVRSMATGEVGAVLAKKSSNPAYPVIALGTELIDVTHAVAPPGVEIAILDEDGDVVYHSDAQRIGYENFFVEADQSRELRSAVLSRRAESVNAPYWGEDQSMYVRPLAGSPWTLVTFRAKRLTRVLNVEGVLLTLLLLLLGATPYLLVYVAVLALAPRYRAPRLWPDSSRWGDYLRLCIILLALASFFYLNNWALQPWSAFYGALLLPIIGIVDVYLVLHRRNAPKRFAVAGAVWTATFALLIDFLLIGKTEQRFCDGKPIGNVLLVVAALALAAMTWFLLVWQGNAQNPTALDRLRDRISLKLRPLVRYSTFYRLIGVLLLATGVAQPTVAFFRISRHVERELLIKYAQLRAVTELENRIDHLARTSIAPRATSDVQSDILYRRFRSVFGGDWSLVFAKREPAADPKEQPDGAWTIPASAAHWLPALYDDSIAVRPLFGARSLDDLWRWRLRDESIELVRRILLEPVVARFVWGFTPRSQSIVITSPLTDGALEKALVLADRENARKRTAGATEQSRVRLQKFISGNRRHPVAETLVALMLLSVFWAASDFIARRVLLIDVDEPKWLARLPLSPTLGDQIFLVRRDQKLKAVTSPDPMGTGMPFFDVSFAKLDAADDWSAMLERLDSSEAGRNVRIVDFEYGINDGTINEKKLQWLERLLVLPDRTVIIVSTVSATYMNTTPPPPSQTQRAGVLWYYDRWRTLLERFVWVTAEELQLRRDARKRPASAPEPQTWLEKETAYNSFLVRLRPELDPEADPHTLIDEIAERADTYYAGLWASCHDDEKLMLYNLARNGLANGRNRRVLRHLIARGFVYRDPSLRLFSETFRRYVIAAARRENLIIRSREMRGASTWDTLRVPFFVIIVSFLLLLVTTQKDLMTTTTALATALTTGIPMVMKLIGAFSERRVDTPEKG
jgi:hypothetical protein